MRSCSFQRLSLPAVFCLVVAVCGHLVADESAAPTPKRDGSRKEQRPLQALVEAAFSANEGVLTAKNFNNMARVLSIPEHSLEDKNEPVAVTRTAEDQTQRGMIVRQLQRPNRLDVLFYEVDPEKVWMQVFLTSSDGKLQRAIKRKNDKTTTILLEGDEAEKLFREQIDFWQKWRAEREKKAAQEKSGKK